jgi:hypothetical protein
VLSSSLVWLGCGSADSGSSGEGGAAGRDSRDAMQVLNAFLQLKRTADHKEADKLLSDKARQVIDNAEQRFTPPVHPSVRTEVGALKTIEQNLVHIPTKWTQGEGPDAQSLDITWVLRDDPQGWRITGLIGNFDSPDQMTTLDFEDEGAFQAAKARAETQKPRAEVAKQPR